MYRIPLPPDLQIQHFPSFSLENGETLAPVQVGYQTWGTLNAAKNNVVVVCHALTGNTDLADWWRGLLGESYALDPRQYFVICMNVLGSCYGTTGPTSLNPATGKPYFGQFPQVTIRDSVNLHKQVLDKLGVNKVRAVIGGSMGGMQALEWCLLYPELVERLVLIASSGRHSAWTIGWSEAQRQAIYADANWQAGDYTEDCAPHAGLAVARMNAMISYRSWKSFQDRFGRKSQANSETPLFSVEGYQRYQGQKLTERFDAATYVRLTQLMDSHDVARGRGEYEAVLKAFQQPALIIGIDSDLLYPLPEQEELAQLIPQAEFRILHSDDGHDAFLIEFEQTNEFIKSFLDSTCDLKEKASEPIRQGDAGEALPSNLVVTVHPELPPAADPLITAAETVRKTGGYCA